MCHIHIIRQDLTRLHTDAIVNAANISLYPGGGVCGAIFSAAGYERLLAACRKIGRCDTGNAVITPGFDLPAHFVIHAVGPVWRGGNFHEPELLYNAYRASLTRAAENGCRSIGFPLISAGIYGYPKHLAWETAITACSDFLKEHPQESPEITFAVLDDHIYSLGIQELQRQGLS